MTQHYKDIAIKRWKNYSLIYAVVSFGLTFTIAAPMFTLFPASFMEQWIAGKIENSPVHAGLIMIFFLFAALIAALRSILWRTVRMLDMQKEMSKMEIIAYMSIYYLIVHSLFFYIYYGVFTSFASDALYLIGAMFSFPFSSTVLYLIGLFTAMYIKRRL